MLERGIFALAFAAAIGSGLAAGVFFAFSSIVMPALGRIPPEQGIAAMQSINVAAINPAFMLLLFGTGTACLLLLAGSFLWWGQAGMASIALAGIVYVLGCVGVTIVCNVPINDALRAVQSGTAEAAAVWTRVLGEWTYWNHVRTVGPLVSAVLFTVALIRRASS